MDPVKLSTEATTFVTKFALWGLSLLPSLLAAAVLLVGGWWIAGRAERGVVRLLNGQSRFDPTLRGVISSLVRYVILILVVIAVLGQLGIQTTSVLAALGAAGLAIGLALQGTLSNIAAGVMLLWLRPFKVGDYIDTGTVAGTVKEVGLFACELHTWEGVFLFVPNSEIWNKRIINYSRLPTRLLDLQFGVGYGDDLAKGREVLLQLAGDPRVHRYPTPEVFVHQLADSAVVLALRAWTSTADYWPVQRALTERGKAALEAAGLTLPPPQRHILVYAEADASERMPAPRSGPMPPP